MTNLIKKLFEAKSIAVIGATSDPVKIGGRPIKYLQDQYFTGKVYPINPKYTEIMGIPCFSDISQINDIIELAVLAVSADRVESEIKKCIKYGVHSFVLFSSGFAEANEKGRHLQNNLKKLATEHNLAILGPNCLGMINASTGLVASFTTAMESLQLIKGGFGFVSQSGALAAYFLDLIQKSGVGLSKWVSTGNEVTLDTSHFIDYFVDDPDTKVIGVYLEDIKDGNLFKKSALKAAKKGKPIVLIKAGSSEAGSKAASSHTGSMTGEDSKYQALFEQLGVIRVRSLSEMIRISKSLLYQGFPKDNTLGIISVSGGAGVLLADEAANFGMSVVDFDNESIDKLKKTLPSFATVQNPMDVTGHVVSDQTIFAKTLNILESDTKINNIVIFIGLMKSISNELFKAIKKSNLTEKKHVSVVWIGATREIIERFESINIPVFEDIPDVIETLSQLYKGYDRQKTLLKDTPFLLGIEDSSNNISLENQDTVYELTEYETKNLLKNYDVPFPKEVLIHTINDARIQMHNSGINYPVVLKIESSELLHKSEHGGLLLNITNEKQMIQGIQQLLDRSEYLGIKTQGILIQEMVKFDHELIIGFQRDPILGSTLILGSGGIYVEVLKDITTSYLPVSKETIIQKIKSLKSSKLLEGYRGKPKIDINCLADIILNLSNFFLKHEEKMVELEINPLAINFETGQFWILDGLAITKKSYEELNRLNESTNNLIFLNK